MIEEVSGSSFAHYLRASVLEPLGMEYSGFETLAADADDIALAHDGRGSRSGDQWHTYPELAAAGLWTTPSDLGRFLIALLTAGHEGNPVSTESVRLMTTPVKNDYALGIIVRQEGGETVWTHSGGNWGYRCVYKVWPQRNLGIIVMTNGDNGGNLYIEIVDAFARHAGLPVEAQAVFPVNTSITTEQQAACAGRYEIAQIGVSFEAYMQDGALHIRSESTPVWRLYPRTDSYYFSLDDNVEVVFKRDTSGSVTGATVILNGRNYSAERRE
jgi:CubicO group peptidase (beta-lactamase class C family)